MVEVMQDMHVRQSKFAIPGFETKAYRVPLSHSRMEIMKRLTRLLKGLKSAADVPCWSEYLRNTQR